ncbi:hypothetical protein RND71_028326 [Anisodus tanguticus]|uniref:RRM domain-containing protein n=1 Tax=Anisodus tanguticus TaxID=243964 RepID=A0AAE1V1H4_9SOLA|nr:hypothetical protein RND71_028326 [Anisodus tanguticus]
MASLFEISAYRDRRFPGTQEEFEDALLKSTTVYMGNMSFYTTEEQVYELFSRVGEIKKIVMGLDKNSKTPCGFCFIMYYSRDYAEDSAKYISGTILDDRPIRVDFDWGFQEGRQWGRGRSGGQVRNEYRTDYDPNILSSIDKHVTLELNKGHGTTRSKLVDCMQKDDKLVNEPESQMLFFMTVVFRAACMHLNYSTGYLFPHTNTSTGGEISSGSQCDVAKFNRAMLFFVTYFIRKYFEVDFPYSFVTNRLSGIRTATIPFTVSMALTDTRNAADGRHGGNHGHGGGSYRHGRGKQNIIANDTGKMITIGYSRRSYDRQSRRTSDHESRPEKNPRFRDSGDSDEEDDDDRKRHT